MSSSEPIVIDLTARERRLYDRLRQRLSKSEFGGRSGLPDLLLLVPDLTVLLVRLARDPRVPPGGKAVALMGVAYVLSPIDLIPEILFGPLGLVDDALILAAALSRLLNYVHPDVLRSHWSGQEDALEAISRLTLWAESLLTERLPRALGRLARRLIGS